ncbi:MAG TPA: lasso RiPP family leader peptide-containing protein [Gemmatimonadaceae bacterium]
MYRKPMVDRFGTLRELTQAGWGSKPDAGTDLAAAFGCESHAAPGSSAACSGASHS